MKYAPVNCEILLVTIVYADKMISASSRSLYLCPRSVHRLFLSCLLVAIKVYSDTFYSNSYMASVGGVPTPELNILERLLLKTLNFDLIVKPEQFNCMQRLIFSGNTLALPVQYSTVGKDAQYWSLNQVEANLAMQCEMDARIDRMIQMHTPAAIKSPRRVDSSSMEVDEFDDDACETELVEESDSLTPTLLPGTVTADGNVQNDPANPGVCFTIPHDRRSASYAAPRPYLSPKPIFGRHANVHSYTTTENPKPVTVAQSDAIGDSIEGYMGFGATSSPSLGKESAQIHRYYANLPYGGAHHHHPFNHIPHRDAELDDLSTPLHHPTPAHPAAAHLYNASYNTTSTRLSRSSSHPNIKFKSSETPPSSPPSSPPSYASDLDADADHCPEELPYPISSPDLGGASSSPSSRASESEMDPATLPSFPPSSSLHHDHHHPRHQYFETSPRRIPGKLQASGVIIRDSEIRSTESCDSCESAPLPVHHQRTTTSWKRLHHQHHKHLQSQHQQEASSLEDHNEEEEQEGGLATAYGESFQRREEELDVAEADDDEEEGLFQPVQFQHHQRLLMRITKSVTESIANLETSSNH